MNGQMIELEAALDRLRILRDRARAARVLEAEAAAVTRGIEVECFELREDIDAMIHRIVDPPTMIVKSEPRPGCIGE